MKILAGLIGMALSFLLLIYRGPVKHFLGKFEWAEEKFGPGGTYTLLVVIALAGFVLSLMYMTGTLDLLVGSTVGTIFKTGK